MHDKKRNRAFGSVSTKVLTGAREECLILELVYLIRLPTGNYCSTQNHPQEITRSTLTIKKLSVIVDTRYSRKLALRNCKQHF
jgi:hypothetical protein